MHKRAETGDGRLRAPIILILLSLSVACAGAKKAEFYVATDGEDTNPGTEGKSFTTLARARDAVRELKGRTQGPIKVWVHARSFLALDSSLLGAAQFSAVGGWNEGSNYILANLSRRSYFG